MAAGWPVGCGPWLRLALRLAEHDQVGAVEDATADHSGLHAHSALAEEVVVPAAGTRAAVRTRDWLVAARGCTWATYMLGRHGTAMGIAYAPRILFSRTRMHMRMRVALLVSAAAASSDGWQVTCCPCHGHCPRHQTCWHEGALRTGTATPVNEHASGECHRTRHCRCGGAMISRCRCTAGKQQGCTAGKQPRTHLGCVSEYDLYS